MNLQLANTEEHIDGQITGMQFWRSLVRLCCLMLCFGYFAGNLGEVLIRCNNVLYIKGIDDEDEEGEMKD